MGVSCFEIGLRVSDLLFHCVVLFQAQRQNVALLLGRRSLAEDSLRQVLSDRAAVEKAPLQVCAVCALVIRLWHVLGVCGACLRAVCREGGSRHLLAALDWARAVREKEAIAAAQKDDDMGHYVARVAREEFARSSYHFCSAVDLLRVTLG